MTLPSMELRPGAHLDQAITTLRELAINCHVDARPVGTSQVSVDQRAYVQWATTTEGRLRTILSTRDAAAFFDGRRHQDICTMAPGGQLLPMINAEINACSERLSSLADELDLTRMFSRGLEYA